MGCDQQVQNTKELLLKAPSKPGVYLMKDTDGKIIYVGKARNLKKRLASYFIKPVQPDIKSGVLVKKISSFETIITGTEKEALILESNLIKKHRPRYNVILKDDKRYPSLRLNIKNQYPNIVIVRKIKKDDALYFGPFSSPRAVRQTLNIINKTFKLRKCKTKDVKKRTRPCLNFQMGMCLAPCCFDIDQKQYNNIVKEAVLFLKGRTPKLIQKIKREMISAADTQDFERASVLRDKMFALEKTIEKQVVVTTDFIDRDVIGVARSYDASVITLLFARGGFLMGMRHFDFAETISTEAEMAGSFIKQYYEKAPFVPKEILVPFDIEDSHFLEELLSNLKGQKVSIHKPLKGQKARLVKMAVENAGNRLKDIAGSEAAGKDILVKLEKGLRINRLPYRIECFDNSNTSGTEAVSAMVVFENGQPRKSLYKRYRIKTVKEQNDYAYIAEVLKRRFKKGEESMPYPDILMVDGGKGQINIAVSILKELNIKGKFEIIGIAKKDETKGETKDKIYKYGRANPLNLDAGTLFFLQRIRDEAHRFAISFHRKRRSKAQVASALDTIPGIGRKRRKILLTHFKSIKRIRAATLEEISHLPGMNRRVAKAVKTRLSQKD